MRRIPCTIFSMVALFLTQTRSQQDGKKDPYAEFSALVSKSSNEDALILNNAFMGMESHLTQAPVALAVLSRIVLLATSRDFTLNDGKSNPEYKYLTHPNSFRASLNQISNSGYFAFLEAHTGMHRIMLETASAPSVLEEALNILLNGTSDDLDYFFPIRIKKIQGISDTCTEIAENVAEEFVQVKRLIGEFQTASINKDGSVANLTEWTEHLKNVAEKELFLRNQTFLEVEEKYEQAKKDFEKKTKMYEDAFEAATPSTGAIVADALADAFIGIVDKFTLNWNPVESFVDIVGGSIQGTISTVGNVIHGNKKNGNEGFNRNVNKINNAHEDMTERLQQLKSDDQFDIKSFFNKDGSINENSFLFNDLVGASDKLISLLERTKKQILEQKSFQEIPGRKKKAIDAIQIIIDLVKKVKKENQQESDASLNLRSKFDNALDLFDCVLKNTQFRPDDVPTFDIQALSGDVGMVKLLFQQPYINNITAFDEQANIIEDGLEKKKMRLKDKKQKCAGLDLIQKAMGTIEKLLTIIGELRNKVKEVGNPGLNDLKKRYKSVQGKFSHLVDVMIPNVIGTIAIPSNHENIQQPRNYDNAGKNSKEPQGINQQKMQRAVVQLETAKEQMRKAQERNDAAFERKLEKSQQLDKLVLEIMQFDDQHATLSDILAILDKAIKAIGELQQSWSKLVIFFKELSNFIKVHLGKRLNGFTDDLRASADYIIAKGITNYGEVITHLQYELLFKAITKASNGAYMTNIQAKTYYNVSQNHLMPLVERLGVLISLDNVVDAGKIAALNTEMKNITREIPKQITQLIRDNKASYDAKVKARKDELSEIFVKFYPAPPKRIEEKIKASVSKVVDTVGTTTEDLDQTNIIEDAWSDSDFEYFDFDDRK